MEAQTDEKDDSYTYETVVDNTKQEVAAKEPPKKEQEEEVHYHFGR